MKNFNVRKVVRFLMGLSVTFLCLYIISRHVEISEIQIAFISFDWITLLYGLACLAVDYLIRVYRWAYILRAMGARITTKECAGPFLGSIALNNVLPFRAGDGVRAFFYPKKMKIKTSMGLSSLMWEKIFDLVVLILMLYVGLIGLGQENLPKSLERSAWFVVFILLVISILLFSIQTVHVKSLLTHLESVRNKNLARLGKYFVQFQKDLALLYNTRHLSSLMTISLLIWVAESGIGYFILRGFGLSVSMTDALLFMSLATISTLVPSSPGYVGLFDLAVIASANLLGATVGQGISIALVLHLTLWFPTTFAGLVAVLKDLTFFREARVELQNDNG